MSSQAVLNLTRENFEETLKNNDIVILDFWASWCGPCRAFAPVFEQTALKHPDVVFAKVNTEEEQEISDAFQIRSIPTIMAFRQNILVFSQAGALPANSLDELIKQLKNLDMDEVKKQAGAE